MKSLKNRINVILSVVFVTLLTFTSCSDPFNSGSRKNTGTTDVTLQIPAELFRAVDASRDGVAEEQSSDSKTASLTIYLYVNKDAPIIKTVSNVDKQKGAEVSFPDIEVGARVWAYAEIQIGSEEYKAFSESTLVSANGTEIILTLELSKINLELGIEEALEQIGSVTVNCYLKITGRLSASQLEELFYKMNYLDRVQIDLDLSETTGLTELERGCANVKSWVLPSSIEYINEGALSNCGWIEDISFPDGNENYLVEDDILYNTAKTLIIRCITSKKTDEFTIPSTVTKIGDAAFFNCRLTKINIPASVESIGAGAFQSSYNLTEFNVASDNANYKSVDGVLFTKDGKELIQYPLLKEGDTYTIPEGVEVIRWYAFGNGYELKTITVPSSAIEIEYGAFWSEEIDSVIFEAPQGWYDYDGNLILEDEISNAVTTRWASYSKMKTETVTADSLYDLIDNYEAERAITYEVTGSMTNDELNDLFNMMNEKRRNRWVSLDMRNVSGITELEKVPNVMKFGIPSGVTSIIEGAFTYTPEILISSENDSFVLEDDVLYTSDKSRLLWYGRNKTATSFTIPDSVVTIDSWGIFGNEFIQEINIPASVQSLGSYNVHNMSAIFECKNLETITVESNSKFYEVVDGVLFEKRSRTLIAYPPSMQGESYTIPDSTTTVIYGAFAYAKNLKSVTVSESVTQLGVNVFSASSLETIVFEDPDDWYIDNNGNKISVTSDQLQNPANYSSTWDGGTGYFENVRLIKESEPSEEFYSIYYENILIGKFDSTGLDEIFDQISEDDYTTMTSDEGTIFNLTNDGLVKILEYNDAIAMVVYNNVNVLYLSQTDFDSFDLDSTYYTRSSISGGKILITLNQQGYETCFVNVDGIVSQIQNMNQSGTISVSGFVSEDGLLAIGNAIRTLYDTDYEIQVALDLSGVLNLNKIPAECFSSCSNLIQIEFPDSVKIIEEFAFCGCNIITLTIAGNIQRIEEEAFFNCTELTELNIGAEVSYICEGAFNSHELEQINLSEDNTAYKLMDGVLFTSDGTKLLIFPSKKTTDDGDYTIPAGVTRIGECSFESVQYISEVIIPDTVVSIGSNAFSGSSITTITIPDSVRTMGYSPFISSTLETIYIGKNLTEIDEEPFRYTRNLTSITVDPDNPAYKSIDGVLYTIDGKTLISYPSSKTGTSFTVPDDVEIIEKSAFNEAQYLTDVTTGNNLKTIKANAFYMCYELENITFGNSIAFIEIDAFDDCNSLETATFTDTQTIWYRWYGWDPVPPIDPVQLGTMSSPSQNATMLRDDCDFNYYTANYNP